MTRGLRPAAGVAWRHQPLGINTNHKRNDLGATSNASGGDAGGDDDAEAGPRSRSLPGIASHGDLELRVEY
jgi:hypothetical protein